MTPLRWGLIGASDIGASRVVPAMHAVGHRVVSVHSTSAARGAAYALANGVDGCDDDLPRLLERDDIDAVYISTRNELHPEQALAAAASGKHILCEKPLAPGLDGAAAMVAAARDAGLVFATNHHLPGAGTQRTVRQLVADGVIGRPLSVRVSFAALLPERLRAGWRLSDAAVGGVVLDLACHNASVVNAILPVRALEVSAMAATQGEWRSEVEDVSMCLVRYEEGVLVQTHEAYTHAFAQMGLEVHGTDASIYASDVMRQDPVGSVFLRDRHGSREVPVTDRRDLYEVALVEFAGAVRGKGVPAVSGADGVRALAVALAAKQSLATARAVTVEPFE